MTDTKGFSTKIKREHIHHIYFNFYEPLGTLTTVWLNLQTKHSSQKTSSVVKSNQ